MSGALDGTGASKAPVAKLLESVRDSSALIPLVGAAVYAGVRVIYALYYGAVGVSPEDVGLGYGRTLVQGGVFIFISLLGAGLGWFVLVRPSRKLAGRLANGHKRLGTSIGVVLTLAGAACFAAGPWVTIGSFENVAAAVGTWISFWAAGIFLLTFGLSIFGAFDWADGDDFWSSARIRQAAAVVPLTVVAALGFAAPLAGNAVRNGAFVPQLVANVSGLQADRALIAWNSGDPPARLEPALNKPVLVLGQADGTLAVYDPCISGTRGVAAEGCTRLTYRIPAASVSIVSRP